MSNKIDSNESGLRYAVESALKVLPGSPVWHPLEPNSYGDFGAKIKTVARNPINQSRQKQKGVVVDLDASANFAMDMTQLNHARLMQGFLFAAAREKPTNDPLNGTIVPVTAVTTTQYAVNNTVAAQFLAGTLFLAAGFANAGNNGLKLAGTPTAGNITTTGNTAEASAPATATVKAVGFEFTTGDAVMTVVNGRARITTTAKDCTTLGLIPGEWVYVGGDLAAQAWTTSKGFARVTAVAAGYIEFDKIQWVTPTAEAGAGKAIRLFTGMVIRNEDNPDLIVRQTYQLERTIGKDADGTMSQYVSGAVANELAIDIKMADKITMDLTFVACDAISRTGLEGVKAGARPAITAADAYNTSSDMKRVALSRSGEAAPLFVYATDISLKIGNAVSGAKAIGVLGNFDTIAGQLDVSGNLTAYFNDVGAVNAVRNNDDITLDVVLVRDNAGIVIDLPLMSLGNGMLKVEQDKPVTVPLDNMAAQSSFGHTMLYVNFPYLPTAASL